MSLPSQKDLDKRTAFTVSTTAPAACLLAELFRKAGLASIDTSEVSRLLEAQAATAKAGNLDGVIEALLSHASALRWLFTVRTSKALELAPEVQGIALDAALAFQSNELRTLELARDFLTLQRQPQPHTTPVILPKPEAA